MNVSDPELTASLTLIRKRLKLSEAPQKRFLSFAKSS
jgi:hypothetical protein